MKKCLKCKVTKPFHEYHRNSRQKDGYHYYCKDCKKEFSKAEYERYKDRYARSVKNYRSTPKGKQVVRDIYRRMREKYPEKYKARTILNSSLRKGLISKPQHCSICRSEKKLSAHHNDYLKPLDVIWMCYTCHTKHHKEEVHYHSN